MAKNKLCCRIFPIILILISFIVSLGLWYFDEGIHSFSFLTDKDEIFSFLGTVLFVAVIPIGFFYWLNDKEKYQSKARAISLLGFIPSILLLIILV
jgi:hypothetical protein